MDFISGAIEKDEFYGPVLSIYLMIITSNCMHAMIQTEVCLQHRGTLWNASVSKQCKHYEKLTAFYRFRGMYCQVF